MVFTKTTQRSIQRQTRCKQIGMLVLHIAQTHLYNTRSTEVETVWRLSQREQGIYVQAPVQETETPKAPL